MQVVLNRAIKASIVVSVECELMMIDTCYEYDILNDNAYEMRNASMIYVRVEV